MGFRPADLDEGVQGTFMGRDALAATAAWLGLRPDDGVLVPAYVCEEVVKPFAKVAQVRFYDVRPNLDVCPDIIRRALEDRAVRAVVLVNYFGFLQPYRNEIRALCADRGIPLIEDCAHSLLTEGSGDTGDVAIYSFRKILPVPDGGGVRVNHAGDRGPMTAQFHPVVYSNVLSLCIMAKVRLRVRADMLSRAGMTSQVNKLSADTPAPSSPGQGPATRRLPLSSFSRRGIRTLPFADVVKRRREDYQFWHDLARRHPDLDPVFPELLSGVCPLGYPVLMRGRDAVRARSDAAGVYLRVHWRLPAGVDASFTASHDLARSMVTLPVYPEFGPRERAVLLPLLDPAAQASAR